MSSPNGASEGLDRRLLMIASAFTHTYWWAVALIIPAIFAALLLPRRKPEPLEDEGPDAGEPAPVLMHA